MAGTLYLVATPIGNLQDISLRALEIVKTVDLIACEDTRRTGKLLEHFGIRKRLISYHEHNEDKRAEELSELLQTGKSVAVLTDAGTPGISDPSYRIVQKAYETGAKVTAIPGAVAFVNALIISGLPTDSIFFGGFLPSKKGERQRRLREVGDIPATLIFYETPHRIAGSLSDCLEILGNRAACVVRELTKLHEEAARGNLQELNARFAVQKTKGEIVLLIDRKRSENRGWQAEGEDSIIQRIRELEKEGFDHKKALKTAAKEFGLSKSKVYKLLLKDKSS